MKNLLVFLSVFLFYSSQLSAQWISGGVITPNGEGIKNVKVTISDASTSDFMITDESGEFSFNIIPNDERIISLEKTDNILNGISPFDFVLMSKSIFGTQPITDTYELIAGDMNNSGSISTLDIYYIYDAVVNFDSVFATVPSWQFVREDHVFDDPLHPVLDNENTTLSVSDISNGASTTFTGIKMGDINNSAIPNAMATGETLKKEIEQIRSALNFLLYFFYNK